MNARRAMHEGAEPKRVRFVKLPFSIALSIACIALLFRYVVDVRDVGRAFRDVDLRYLRLAAAIITAERALMTYKWILLLRAQGHRLPWLEGMKIYCSAMLWGSLLPTTVGADAVRAVLVMRRGIGGADVTASIIVERMI